VRRAGPLVVLLLVALAACGPREDDGQDAAAAPDGAPPAHAAPFPDASLILVSLDTLRADDLSFLGGPPNISPTLAALAEESIVFEHARAPAPHTAPSHMSLFTSLYPSVHGVQNVAQREGPDGRSQTVIVPLPDDVPTLAEVLREAGFATIGLTDGGNLNRAHGFPRGFDEYTVELSGVEAQVADALARLDAVCAPGAPRTFLFWHTYQIHSPYAPPRAYMDMYTPEDYEGPMREVVEGLVDLPFREKWGKMRSVYWRGRDAFSWPESAYLHGLYKGEIRFTDRALGALVDAWRARGLLDRSVLVVLSDHGEEFFEHGKWQHDQVFEECLRVPLLVRLPGGAHGGRRVDLPVSLLDVMPTVLDLLGVPRDGLPLAGRSLARHLLDGTEPEERPVFSELRWNRGDNYPESKLAIHFQGLKYIADEHHGVQTLFDLRADPGERDNLLEGGHPRAARFRELHEAFGALVELGARREGVENATVDDETRRQLIELGYLSDEPGEDR